jgi:hypothetical protein
MDTNFVLAIPIFKASISKVIHDPFFGTTVDLSTLFNIYIYIYIIQEEI